MIIVAGSESILQGIVALHQVHRVQRVADHVSRVAGVFTVSHVQIVIVVRSVHDRMPSIGVVLAARVLLIVLLGVEVVRIVLVVVATASASMMAASSVTGGELVAWAQSTESVVRVDAQPLVVVTAAGVQVLAPVVRSNRVVLRAAAGLLVTLQAAASEYLPSQRCWLASN